MKTPEQMASDYANAPWPTECCQECRYLGFLAGYNRCSNDNSYLTVTKQSREVLRVTPTETGFDVVIPDGITMTEAAQIFVNAVKDIIKQGNNEQNT